MDFDDTYISVMTCPMAEQVRSLVTKVRAGTHPAVAFKEVERHGKSCSLVHGHVVHVSKVETLFFGQNFVTIYRLTFADQKVTYTSVFREGT